MPRLPPAVPGAPPPPRVRPRSRSPRIAFSPANAWTCRAIARELGLARATMHRWFGRAPLLLGEVLAALAEERLLVIRSAVTDSGAGPCSRRFDRFNREVAATGGLRALLVQEQERALRILTSSAGSFSRAWLPRSSA